MPAMEAMASGCAVVTTDTGGSRDYAIDRETALVSTPKDVEGLANNLTTVLDDQQLKIRLAKTGQKKIMEFDGSIGRAIVADDDFYIRVILIQERLNAVRRIIFSIPVDDDGGNFFHVCAKGFF